ncbi:hypothetical protein ACS8E9_04695 [Pseudomonas neustonica]|jgi:hypothetical protein|uniref:hypothetical protein n=1 Tax=Pseudomonas TaxID=286 RepID=UPI000C91E5F9|nr:hypothetical protein [Pseudomonas sp. 5Ae-yellow]MAB25797.1 hypothetical protein [Pseudomonadales bacterium]MBA6419816.1 hypothetical protein [Pseudomonas sp. 5Ae-yellow]|tara:strand:- start:399 stop:614 length:216 start_codon:yes stop_codon:yes gene_type:complete
MRADEFLKKHGLDQEEDKDISLRGQALERALHPGRPHAGTPHDWEDWERYQAEEKAKAAQSKAELNKKADD